jgi:RNA polymerase sigma-70 factor (ECF subfamily)
MPSPAAIPDPFDALSDDQLMLAYAGGNVHAFDALYARHESAVLRFVRRLLGLRLAAEVEEVFKETWSRIVSARDAFSPKQASWRVWAFTIAYRMANERLRISGREVAFYAHDEDGDGLDAAQLFSRGLLRDGAAANDAAQPPPEELAFWQAADQRAAFLLHQEEGFTIEAMAATLDVGAETVRGHQGRALKKLRGCMERYLSVLELRA